MSIGNSPRQNEYDQTAFVNRKKIVEDWRKRQKPNTEEWKRKVSEIEENIKKLDKTASGTDEINYLFIKKNKNMVNKQNLGNTDSVVKSRRITHTTQRTECNGRN